ncbi:uncharacterized mitochondrial protein-like protein [Tanacetum coccineum]
MTHSHPKRNFVPRAVLMKSGLKTLNTARQNSSSAAISVNNARPINTAYPRPTVNSARTTSNVFNRAHSHGNPYLELQEKGVIDSGCSRHMTGNKSYLSNYEETDGGFVAFGGNPKGGKITRKGGLTYLFAKATLDESNLWHRSLGHINFTTMNKLVKGNLVKGKFDGKADEGFFVGYSVNRSGPEWLFDIDTLTKSVNYKLVVTGNQTNGNAGTKESIDAGQAGKKIVPSHEYILLPLWTPNAPISSSPKRSDDEVVDDAGKKSTKDPANEGDKDDQDLRDEFEREFERLFVQGKEAKININSTNSISAISSPINTARTKDVDDELMMPNLEDTGIFGDAYDDEDFVARGDMNNLESSMSVSPIATIRVHKDHLVELIIGDLHSAPQTKRMTKNYEEHGLVSLIQKQRRTNHKDFKNCLFACFLSQVEPKKVIQALTDPSWIEAMHDELLQFKLQKMDVKSAFLYGKIEEEVYVCQPPGFEDPEFTDRVYKVEKALYGLHQAPRAYQDKYVDEILKKFGFSTMKTASTPMETLKPLMKDENAEDVDVHLYRSMIGSFMYLTSLRPDIMFVVCACARIQVTPKVSHLHAVKRIFRYLKGQPKLGLWYPKDSPFDLEAYTDSDYVGASLDRKSTTGCCQFLGSRLIS